MKKAFYFILPMFISLMYTKLIYQVYNRMDFSNDAIFTFFIVNFLIYVAVCLIFVFDIYNIIKGKSLTLEIKDEDLDREFLEDDTEELLKGYKWNYTFTYDSKGNEKAVYVVETNKLSCEIEAELLKDYLIEYKENKCFLTYKN